MKKHSQLVMILSALLCLAMLFASCTPAPDEDETVGETGTETETVTDTEPETEEEVTMEPEPTPDNLAVDYAAIISQWQEYIQFGSTESADEELKTKIDELFYYDVNDDYIERSEDLILVRKDSSTEKQVSGEEVNDISVEYRVYNRATGQQILKRVTEYRNYITRPSGDANKYENAGIEYAVVDILGYYGVVVVSATEYIPAVQDDPNTDADESKDWERKTTYSYYDQDGNLLVKDLETNGHTEVYSDNAYCKILRIGNQYFTSSNNRIVSALGENVKVEFDFPHIDREYKGYKYEYGEEIYDQFAEEWATLLKVLDTKTHQVTVTYPVFTSQYDDWDYYVLGNGNILFAGVYLFDQDSADGTYCDPYDFRDPYNPIRPERAYKIFYRLIDAKTGEVTDVMPTCTIGEQSYGFVVEKLISNYYGGDYGITLKNEDHQYAEIRLIKDGVLSTERTAVILDSQFQVVKVLDEFVRNQFSMYGVLDSGDLLILTVDNHYYTVDVDGDRTEKVLAYVNRYAMNRIISGGFVKNGILYNDDLKPLVNLYEKYDEEKIFDYGDHLRAWSLEDRCTHYLFINENGELVTTTTPEEGTYSDWYEYNTVGCTIYEESDDNSTTKTYTVYNAAGQEIGSLTGTDCYTSNGLLCLENGTTRTYYTLK